MTDSIPTEAVEAAARALVAWMGIDPDDTCGGDHAPAWTEWVEESRVMVTAAAPHIAAQATADLLAGIEALRDEWRSAADAAFAAYPNPIGTRDGFPRGCASAQSVHADALDALLRERA